MNPVRKSKKMLLHKTMFNMIRRELSKIIINSIF